MRVLAAILLNVVFAFAVGLLVAKFLGPDEYGRFALALATAVAVQTAFLDWIRLGATRFYSQRVREEAPALRATLDVAFAMITLAMAVGTILLFSSGAKFPLSNQLIALALAAAVANGLFDLSTALVRARFNDDLFLKLIVVKNLLALLLTGGGAFYFGSARMTLIGGVLSLSGSVIAARAGINDRGAKIRLATVAIARSILRYAAPIVLATLLYLCIPLANRTLIAVYYGFSETGQFSLAYDVGMKAVQAVGSTLDVLLFQIAVAAHDRHGVDQARKRIADNISIVIAIMLPACTGIWLVMPSLQMLIVPEQFRGPFDELLTLMLPGLFCFAIILYAVAPIFQIAKRTAPLIGAAVIACVTDPVLLSVLPRTNDAASLAIAQSGSFAVALLALVAMASLSKPVWPRWRELVSAAFATAAMVAILLPFRSAEPKFSTLLAQIAGGASVYGVLVAVFDIAEIRTLLVRRLRPMVARLRPG